ncbi:MAG: SoxR reducing system RseC family protein [Planctomycetota bacterium]
MAVREGRATVEIEPSEHCAGCALGAMCGAGKLRLEVDGVDGLERGQSVILAVDRSAALRGVLLLFGLPLVGLVSGVVLGRYHPVLGLSADGSSLLLGVLFLAAAFAAAFLYEKTIASKRLPEPSIVRTEES